MTIEHSSNTIFYKELTNIRQTLVNKFPNKLVNQQIKLYLHNIPQNNTTTNNNTNRINLYYRNQMCYNYKLDKQAITNIIKRHNKPIKNKWNLSTSLNLKHQTS